MMDYIEECIGTGNFSEAQKIIKKSRNKFIPYAKQPLPTGSGCYFIAIYTTRTRMTSGIRSIFAT